MRFIISFALAVFLMSPTAVLGQSFSDGVEAYRSGDYGVAFDTMSTLAKEGDPAAQFNLAVMYRAGRGVVKNLPKAAEWNRRAAEQGHIDAQTRMGFMYEQGDGVVQNYSEAVKWYRRAARQGDPVGQNFLGSAYVTGTGVNENRVLGYVFTSLAAAQGREPAAEMRDLILEQLSREQITQAQRIASKWQVGMPLPRPEDVSIE